MARLFCVAQSMTSWLTRFSRVRILVSGIPSLVLHSMTILRPYHLKVRVLVNGMSVSVTAEYDKLWTMSVMVAIVSLQYACVGYCRV